MTNDPNAEILTASEFAVGVAKKELGKTLDYSKDSLKDLEALIQHVKNHFLKLKTEGKPTEQTFQRASLSIGGYLGEVIRRHHGGTWIAKNTVMKTLSIDSQEFSPILYVFERLTKDSGYSLENYWSDIHRKLYPQPSIENNPPVQETPKKTANSLTGNRSVMAGGLIGIAFLCIVGITSIRIFANAVRIPPTVTPRPTATRIPATPTPSLIKREPINYLQNLPSGYVVNDSVNSRDVTLGDGSRLFSIGLTNKQAFNHGDVVTVQYFITTYPSESKAVSEYYKYLIGLEGQENGVLDSEVGIEGADDSAMYFFNGEHNIVEMHYISRVKNVMITTVGLTIYGPEMNADSFLQGLMEDVAELHILGIDNTHR